MVAAAAAALIVAALLGKASLAQVDVRPEVKADYKPGDTFKDCDVCPEMVVLPAGEFTMGSPKSEKDRRNDEGPQHTVTIARPFAVGRFEVTKAEFEAFVRESHYDAGDKCWTFEGDKINERSGRSWRNPGFSQSGDHPVACVDWDDGLYGVAVEEDWEGVLPAAL